MQTAKSITDDIIAELLADIILPTIPAPQDATQENADETRKRDAVRLARLVAYL